MVLKIFAVYDSKAESYMQPFFMQTAGMAIRAFADTVNREPNSALAAHPGDFTLFQIAEYEQDTGEFTQLPAKINLGTALEHKKPSMQQTLPFTEVKNA